MEQPNREQLCLEWEIVTNEAMAALSDWAKQLETWRLSKETVPDKEFMAAYGKLANVVDDWADGALSGSWDLDALRETLTGVDPINGLEPAAGLAAYHAEGRL